MSGTPAVPTPLPMAARGVGRYVPITHWARNYPAGALRGDAAAGFTVAVMLVPQGMAYANLAGMPPVTGLYAAIVGIVAYAVFGTSGALAVGPVAITSLLTVSGLSSIVSPDDPTYPAVAAILALSVGVILVVAGIARLGFVVNFLSHPVISGFTSAAAITIGLSQVKDLLGVDIGRPDGVVDTVRDTVGALGTANVPTVVIGVAAIVVLAVGRKLAPRFPTPLVVLVASTAVTWALSLTDRGVAVLGSVPTGLPSPQVPELTGGLVADVAPVALAIAVIAYAEGVSVAKAIARRQRSRIDANQELVATGAANVAAGMFGAFPVAGGFSRTAVNDQAGSRTPLASLITAVVLAVAVVWLTPALFYLPKAVLAAVVIVAVSGLVDVADARETWRTRKSDFVALAVTFVVTLVVGVEPGLATGVVFSLVLFIYRSANPHTTELGRVVGSTEFRNVDRWQTRGDDRMVLLRVDGPLFFANTKYLADRVAALLADRPSVTHVVLDAAGIGDLDASGSHALAELDADLDSAGVTLLMATVRGPVRDVMAAAGLWDPMRSRIFASVNDAVASVDPASALLVADGDEPPTTVV